MYLRLKNKPQSKVITKTIIPYKFVWSEAFQCYIDVGDDGYEFRYFNNDLIELFKLVANNRNQALLNINHSYFTIKFVCEEILYFNNTIYCI